MNKSSVKIAWLCLTIALLMPAAAPAQGTGADTNAATAFTNPIARPFPATHHFPPIHGSVIAVDTNAMTLSIGNSVFSVSPKTKITKAGKVESLSDLNVGEYALVIYTKASDGTLNALAIRTGTHPPIKLRQPTDATSAPPTPPTVAPSTH